MKSTHLLLLLIPCAGLSLFFTNCSSPSSGSASASTDSAQSGLQPGINTSNGWSDSPFISRDGKRLYFAYSRYNFAPYLQSVVAGQNPPTQPQATGPDRIGLHHSTNPWNESDYYVSNKQPGGTWSTPVALSFNGAYGDASGKEVTDSSGNVVGFVWLQGNGTTNNIVEALKNSDGTWGAPTILGGGINNASYTQDNPAMVQGTTGGLLWFTSNRTGGLGGSDIWFSSQTNGTWSTPVNVGAPINTTGNEDQAWVSQVSQDVYWNGPQGLMHCVSNGSTCPTSGTGAPTPVTISGCSYPAQASVTDDGQYLYYACGNTTTYFVSIMYSVKQANGSWGPATPVD